MLTSVERSGWLLVTIGVLSIVIGAGMQYRNGIMADDLLRDVERAHSLARRAFVFADDCVSVQIENAIGSLEVWTLMMPVWPRVEVPEEP